MKILPPSPAPGPKRSPLPTVSVVDGSLRYVRGYIGPTLVESLFDSSKDPKELQDLASSDPDTVARMRGMIDGRLGEESAFGEAETREIGEMELNQLRAIGYDLGI